MPDMNTRVGYWFVPGILRRAARVVVKAIGQWQCRRVATMEMAEKWAERIKKYPGIYSGIDTRRAIRLPESGFEMVLGLVDVVERTIRVEGGWDRDVEMVLRQHLGAGDVFFDVGANIGYFSLFASYIVGTTEALLPLSLRSGRSSLYARM